MDYKSKNITLQIEFDDNAFLPVLFGEHNIHLTKIESDLDVVLNSRGNKLLILGSELQVKKAQKIIKNLYNQARSDKTLDLADVDGVLRMAEFNGQNEKVSKLNQEYIKTKKRQIRARSPQQAAYLNNINKSDLVFGLGPAGTGKTYLAVAKAVEALVSERVDRIVLSRPAVEAGERLGFLPGDMREKVDPYLRPLYDALYDMLPEKQVVNKIDRGIIEVAPLAFMRGRTLSNAFVILDEAQNTTPVQMKMLLTRLGENAAMVITGDLSQIDLPKGVNSGLRDAIKTLQGVDGVSFVYFDDTDVVRHPLVARIIKAYDKKDVKKNK